jgi:hypothetical protein
VKQSVLEKRFSHQIASDVGYRILSGVEREQGVRHFGFPRKNGSVTTLTNKGKAIHAVGRVPKDWSLVESHGVGKIDSCILVVHEYSE